MGTDERARLRALYEAATQTPWRHDGAEITVVGSTLGVDGGETVIAACTLPDCAEVADEDREEQEERNAALMVAAVNALPALLDRVEAAEARVAELEARVAELEARGLALAEDARTAYAQRREMGREAQRLREIIAGRTTPPTDAEIAAHDDAWIVTGPHAAGYPVRVVTGDDARKLRDTARGAWVWTPWRLATGRPCGWPTVAEVSRG